jgi:hypothetical protein
MFKPLKFGHSDDQKNRELFIELCEKSNLFDKEVLPTLENLQALSKLNDADFSDRCFSFYIGIEEDDWDPSKEICALCLVMKMKEDKSWHPESRDWLPWYYSKEEENES